MTDDDVMPPTALAAAVAIFRSPRCQVPMPPGPVCSPLPWPGPTETGSLKMWGGRWPSFLRPVRLLFWSECPLCAESLYLGWAVFRGPAVCFGGALEPSGGCACGRHCVVKAVVVRSSLHLE